MSQQYQVEMEQVRQDEYDHQKNMIEQRLKGLSKKEAWALHQQILFELKGLAQEYKGMEE